MSVATVVPPGGGEIIGDATDRRVEILSDHESLHATWSRFGPGRDGADLHIHRLHHDLFYVLDGTFTLRLGAQGERVEIPAGQIARVPPLVVHGFRNTSDGEMRYLNLHAPGRDFANYLRAMRDGRPYTYDQYDPPADGGRPIEDAVVGPEPVDVEEIAAAVLEIDGAGDGHEHDVTESLYVIEGQLELDGNALPAGTWAQIPAGESHALGGRARVLAIHTPGAGLEELQRPARAA